MIHAPDCNIVRTYDSNFSWTDPRRLRKRETVKMILTTRATPVGMMNESTVYMMLVKLESLVIRKEILTPIPAMPGFASNSPSVTLPYAITDWSRQSTLQSLVVVEQLTPMAKTQAESSLEFKRKHFISVTRGDDAYIVYEGLKDRCPPPLAPILCSWFKPEEVP